MIKINKEKYPTCPLYNEQDNLVGLIQSEYELNDIRIQLLEQKLEGYYIKFEDISYYFDKFSCFIIFPEKLFPSDKQLRRLVQLQVKTRLEEHNIKVETVNTDKL